MSMLILTRKYNEVSSETFLQAIARVPDEGQAMLTHYDLIDTQHIEFYLDEDALSGYGIDNGELVNLFSLESGRGSLALQDAIRNGARHLNCFDTWLTAWYARNGFVEYKREANWTPGEPDVVYMSR